MNEFWRVLLGGTKLERFYYVERNSEGCSWWNEVGRVLLEVSFLVMSSLLLRNYICAQFFSLTC